MEKVVKDTLKETFEDIAKALETGSFGQATRVGLTILGSEHGPEELVAGAELAARENPDMEVVVIGTGVKTHLEMVEAKDPDQAHQVMDKMLEEKSLDAAVTLHYNFPIGVATTGQVITPARGRKMFLGSTTGTSDTQRTAAMIKNTIASVAVAKATGIDAPTVGLLNIEGARAVEKALTKLKKAGYDLHFTESARADGGVVMRGNDLLQGVPDLMVMDSLTGNVMMKMFSSFATGGSYEAQGFGYGPGVGQGYDRIVGIISRASGAPVVAGAIQYMGRCAQGDLVSQVDREFEAASKAGLKDILQSLLAEDKASGPQKEAVKMPPKKTCTSDIPGIEILDLEDAVEELWRAGIYAESGMGCTGPIVMMADEDYDKAKAVLAEKEYI